MAYHFENYISIDNIFPINYYNVFLKLIYDLIFNRNDYVYWVQFLSSMSVTMPSHL